MHFCLRWRATGEVQTEVLRLSRLSDHLLFYRHVAGLAGNSRAVATPDDEAPDAIVTLLNVNYGEEPC